MKIKSITLETLDDGLITFKLKKLKSLYLNEIEVWSNYKHWIKTGEKKPVLYILTPESLGKLVSVIKTTKLKNKIITNSSVAFLESYPTLDIYLKEIERINSLPIYEPPIMKSKS